jgi:hypothetical protein
MEAAPESLQSCAMLHRGHVEKRPKKKKKKKKKKALAAQSWIAHLQMG